ATPRGSPLLCRFFYGDVAHCVCLRFPTRRSSDLEGGSILTLSNRGEVIGACALLREEDGVMQLARMAVAAGERGKGWGRILLATALQRARQLGARRVRLFSNTRLGAAIHLYEAFGFRAVHRGPHPRYARCNIVMECELPPVEAGGTPSTDPAPEVEA